MQYHNQLIIIKGIEILLENEGPGFERDGLRTCRSLKSWIAQVFEGCEGDYTVLKRKLDVWTSLTDEQVYKIDQSIQRHLAAKANEVFGHFLVGFKAPDLNEMFWDAIEKEVDRQTNLTVLLGGNQ